MTNFELIKSNIITIQSAVNLVMQLGQKQFINDAEGEATWSWKEGDTRSKLWEQACIKMQEMSKLSGELVATINIIEELSNATE